MIVGYSKNEGKSEFLSIYFSQIFKLIYNFSFISAICSNDVAIPSIFYECKYLKSRKHYMPAGYDDHTLRKMSI